MRRGPASRLALAAIRGYQRWISPYKGYRCALCSVTGGESCSNYGFRVVERFGLRRGLGLLNRRFALCAHVHRSILRPAPVVRNPWRHKEQGHCDSSCDTPCDGDCSWEWGETRRRDQERKRDKAHMDALARRIAKKNKKQPPTPK